MGSAREEPFVFPLYRLTYLLGDWVVLTWIWDVPLSCLGSTAAAVQPNGLWNIPNPSEPNPGPRGDGSPCTCIRPELSPRKWNSQFPKIALPSWYQFYRIPSHDAGCGRDGGRSVYRRFAVISICRFHVQVVLDSCRVKARN